MKEQIRFITKKANVSCEIRLTYPRTTIFAKTYINGVEHLATITIVPDELVQLTNDANTEVILYVQ